MNPFWRWKDVFITEEGDVRISREVTWGGSLKCGTLKHAVTKALQRHMRQEQKCEDLGAKGCPFSFVFGQLLAGDGIWVNPCQAAARLVSWIWSRRVSHTEIQQWELGRKSLLCHPSYTEPKAKRHWEKRTSAFSPHGGREVPAALSGPSVAGAAVPTWGCSSQWEQQHKYKNIN